jgi:hypothetical protein
MVVEVEGLQVVDQEGLTVGVAERTRDLLAG